MHLRNAEIDDCPCGERHLMSAETFAAYQLLLARFTDPRVTVSAPGEAGGCPAFSSPATA